MKKLQLLAFWMAMLSFSSCSVCPDQLDGDPLLEGKKWQNFSLQWEPYPGQWQAMIGAFGLYDHLKVKLLDETGKEVEEFETNVGGRCTFPYVDSSTPRNEDITRTFYLVLKPNDTDTIRMEYKVNKSHCKPLLNYGRLYYNNNLIESTKNDTGIPFASIDKKYE